MDKSNMADFAKIFSNMAIVYEKALDKDSVRLYFDILKDYKIEDVKKASDQHLKISKYFPKPSELVILIQPSLLHQKNEFGF